MTYPKIKIMPKTIIKFAEPTKVDLGTLAKKINDSGLFITSIESIYDYHYQLVNVLTKETILVFLGDPVKGFIACEFVSEDLEKFINSMIDLKIKLFINELLELFYKEKLDQVKIKKAFIKYLQLLADRTGYDKEHLTKFIKYLEDSSGFCFGFALCFGAMAATKSLPLYYKMFESIYDWYLGKIELSPELERYFELAINYIVFHQGKHIVANFEKPETTFEELTGFDFISWDLIKYNFVEVSFSPGKIKENKYHIEIGGNFSLSDLTYLLSNLKKLFITADANHIDTITMVSGFIPNLNITDLHICYLQYDCDQNKWIFYDCNYYKHYLLDDDLAMAIIVRAHLGLALKFNIVFLDDKAPIQADIDVFLNLIAQAVKPENFADEGFYLIAESNIKIIKDLIGSAENDEKILNTIAAALIYVIKFTALNISGFRYLLTNAKDIFLNLLQLTKHQIICDNLVNALEMISGKDNKTGFDCLVELAPEYLPNLLDLAKTNVAIKKGLIKALEIRKEALPDSLDKTVLQAFTNLFDDEMNTVALGLIENSIFRERNTFAQTRLHAPCLYSHV